MTTPLNISPDLALNLEDIIGQCVAILGIRGSGKSNTAGVIFEELLRNNYPLSIIDIDGEYFGLKEKYEVLVVGRGEGVEIEVDSDCAEEIARISLEKNVPVVLDLSTFLSEERSLFLKEYLSSLWTLAGNLRRPYIIGIEEAHEFIPQGVRSELKELIARIALRGRKRGLGAIIVSQRSAKVDKDVLSQAGMLFLHRVVHEVDMRVYAELLPWRKSEVKEIVSALNTGDCVYVNGETVVPVYVRERETFHAGFTPSLQVVVTPELKQVSQSIIEAIERAKDGQGKKSRLARLRERVGQLEALLTERDKKIGELEDIARTLGYIKVEAVAPPLPDVQHVSEAIAHSAEGNIRDRGEERLSIRPVDRQVVRGALDSWSEKDSVQDDRPIIDIDSPRNLDQLPRAVRRHISRIVSRLERRPLIERRLVGFLIGHTPISYSVRQIAAWTDCAEAVIVDSPPRDLLDARLVVTERRSDGIYYRGNLKAFVMREFAVYRPDIGAHELHLVTQVLCNCLTSLASETVRT